MTLFVLALVLVPAPSAPQELPVFTPLTQSATAVWGPFGKHHRYYHVRAVRTLSSEGPVARAEVGWGRCRITSGGYLFCRGGQSRSKQIPWEDFDANPATGAAELALRIRGRIHRVSWQATGPFDEVGEDPCVTAVYRETRAKARGKVYGKRVQKRGVEGLTMIREAAGPRSYCS